MFRPGMAEASYSDAMTSDGLADRPGVELLAVLRSTEMHLSGVRAEAESLLPSELSDRLLQALGAAQANGARLSQADGVATALALLDARQLDGLLQLPQPSFAPAPVLVAVADRVVGHLGRLLLDSVGHSPASPERLLAAEADDKSLYDLAAAYGRDASREGLGASRCGVLAVVAIAVSVASATVSTALAASHPKNPWPMTTGLLIVCAAAGLIGLALVRAVSRRQLAAREYTR